MFSKCYLSGMYHVRICFICQVGELIGGSQREERLEYIEDRLDELKLNKESFWWYLDLRRYGSGEKFQFLKFTISLKLRLVL